MICSPYPKNTVAIVCMPKDGSTFVASGGSAGFLTTFFNTVALKLEDGVWGSRFPVLMRDLYAGDEDGVSFELSQTLRKEITIIQNEFHKLSISDVAWDFRSDSFNAGSIPPNQLLSETFSKIFSDFYRCLDGLDLANGGKVFLTSAQDFFSTQ